MANRKKTPLYEDEQNQSGALGKVVAALVCIAVAVLGIYLLVAKPMENTAMGAISNILHGLGGAIAFVIPLIFIWVGVMFILSASKKRLRAVNIITNAILFLCLFTAVQLFQTSSILRLCEIKDFPNYIVQSYRAAKGGGFIGALLAYPLRTLGVWGGMIVLVLAAIICLTVSGKAGRFIAFVRSRSQKPEQTFEEKPVRRDPPRRRDPYDDVFAQPEAKPAPQKKRRMYRETFGEQERPIERETSIDIPKPLRRLRDEIEIEPEELPKRRKSTFPRDIPDFFELAPDDAEPLVDVPTEAEIPIQRAPKRKPAKKPVAEVGRATQHEDDDAPFDVPRKPAKKTVVEGVRPLGVEGSKATQHEDQDDDAPFDIPHTPSPAPKFERRSESEETEEEYYYPPIDLLKKGDRAKSTKKTGDDDTAKAEKLIETLLSFGIETRLIGVAHGPVVTRFELQPAPGIKVSRITALADDIALSLAALSVRIEAPIPGKAAVGVEIPNDRIETVCLRDVLECSEAKQHTSRIAVGLGKDNSGRYIVTDVAKMPHVLIAGQTGSGKSVCINSIIVSILYRATPDEVRMILIDPKVVELSIYNEIPHLIAPVVTDPKKAASALEWAVAEMDSRYKRFGERGVRDIKGYNKALEKGEKPMPQIVIVIDELADLMMVAPGEVESSICRLAQLARACGMHLVIATQRPSVNVITGVIKANIPTRIAFAVASQVDSRTMIDHGGAEKLLGNGDMLFVPPGISKPMRVQGAWVSDDEVHAIVNYIKVRSEITYDEDVVERIENSVRSDAEREEVAAEYDSRLEEAVAIVVEAGQASVSMLQRRMRVGYARAGRLIDEMERRGIVSEADGAKPRNVLISHEQLSMMFDDSEKEEP